MNEPAIKRRKKVKGMGGSIMKLNMLFQMFNLWLNLVKPASNSVLNQMLYKIIFFWEQRCLYIVKIRENNKPIFVIEEEIWYSTLI